MHPHDENLFVVGPVEDADPPSLGEALRIAPHEVVVEVFRRGVLERDDLAALRIDARHDVLDRAVLARSVHSLENEQQRPAILRVEHLLLGCEPLGSALKELGRLAFLHLETARVARVEVLQLKALAFGDAERVDVPLDTIQDLFSRHLATSLR